MTESRQ